MSEYVPIPVHTAKSIADNYAKSMVVILAYDPIFQVTHTTTYGKDAWEKEQAAAVGEKCSLAIGADLNKQTEFEDFHKDYDPAALREATEILQDIARRQDSSPHTLLRVERWLKAIGLGVRSDG
jgi:hypothetical protein